MGTNRSLQMVGKLLEYLNGQNGDTWLKKLEVFLGEEWPIFRTIEIGTSTDQQSLHSAVERSGAKITRWAADLLSRTPLSDTKMPVELIVASVGELGYPGGTQLRSIYTAGVARGWQLCPAEVGPQLAIQYADQPVGEFLVMAMEPIVDSGSNSDLFVVECLPRGRYLHATFAAPDRFWHSGCRFVFVRCK